MKYAEGEQSDPFHLKFPSGKYLLRRYKEFTHNHPIVKPEVSQRAKRECKDSLAAVLLLQSLQRRQMLLKKANVSYAKLKKFKQGHPTSQASAFSSAAGKANGTQKNVKIPLEHLLRLP